MDKTIVITSIFYPGAAVMAYAGRTDCQTIVVGDRKTPADWVCDGVDFIAVDDQSKLGFDLGGILPYNHYCRKMLGYLQAIRSGAGLIIDTDDDNYPKDNWGFPDFHGEYDALGSDDGFANMYRLFTTRKIWPRGYPLDLVSRPLDHEKAIQRQQCTVGIWQGLADEDPDVDAIYRLCIDEPCYFNGRDPVVLKQGTVCPFNTQNTAIRKELFPLLYLPTYVTFRFTDILRGLIAQPIMWLYGYHLGFTGATVVQKRNPHDYMKDFIDEVPMYLNSRRVVEIVSGAVSGTADICSNLLDSYRALLSEGIVEDRELHTLEAWLNDISVME